MLRQFLKIIFGLLPAPPTTRYVWRKETNPYDFLPPSPVVYDIGARTARGRYSFGNPPPNTKLLCIDVEDLPGVDIVADAHDLHMIENGSADCVLAVGVLLHCRNPDQVIREFERILKPGGILYVAVPFISPHPGYAPVYQFFSTDGLEERCATLEKIDCGFNRGPASTTSYLLLHFNSILFSFGSRTLFAVNHYFFSWLLFWTKYLDIFLVRLDPRHLIYSESFFIGRKRS